MPLAEARGNPYTTPMPRLLPTLLFGLLAAGLPAAHAQIVAWEEVAPMPTARAYAAVAVLNGQIYVMGGRAPNGAVLGVVERYDPVADTWQQVASLREPRYGAAATVLNGRILLTGGREADGRVTDDVEEYVPGENDWESFDSLEDEREGHAAFTIGNTAYVFGGYSESGVYRADAEYYDPGEEDWYEYPNWTLDAPRAAFAAVVQAGGVLIFGGYSQFGPLAAVEFYVPGTGGESRASLEEPRGALAGAGNGTRAWAIGGKNALNEVVSRVDVYDQQTNKWTTEAPLPTPREGAVAAVVNDTVYVFGGYDGQGLPATTSLKGVTGTIATDPRAPDAGFALDPAGPNPFRDGTRLALRLDRPAAATVAVYDVLGRRVALLHEGPLAAGRHVLAWDGTGASGQRLAAGLYVVRAVAGERQATLHLTRVP